MGLHTFDKSLAKANTWLKELMTALGCEEAQAHQALRAVLHSLRDRLPVSESARLAAQLPRLVRGLYFEGWHPGEGPLRLRREEEFYAAVRQYADGLRLDARVATDAVLRLLGQHISAGEVEGVLRCLPDPLRTIWPRPAAWRGRREPGDRQVHAVMSPHVFTCEPDDLVQQAVQRMYVEGIRHIVVLSPQLTKHGPVPEDAILGILSSEDAALLARDEPSGRGPLLVRDVMTPAPLVTVRPDVALAAAAALMRNERVHALPVIAAGELTGILTTDDVLRGLSERAAA